MKCSNDLINNIKGMLLFNCDKSNNTFAGLALASATATTINGLIADGSLLYVPFKKASDALSANNQDADVATDGYRTTDVNSARIGINALLDCIFGQTINQALKAGGAQMGYLVHKDGYLIGKLSDDGTTWEMIKLNVTLPSPLPNTPSVNSTNMPNVQISVNFGSTEEVADWRMNAFAGLTSPNDLLELEMADLVPTSTTTAELRDFTNKVITGANDDSTAGYVYSSGSAHTTAISNGVITFTTTTAGETVTVEGSISGYRITKPIVMPS